MNDNAKECPYADDLPVVLGSLTLAYQEDGQFVARWGAHAAHAKAICCFPWSHPDGYVSLRDDDAREIAFVPTLDALDESSSTALIKAMRESRFMVEITAIRALDEEYEIRNWRVETKQGPRTFQTHREEWPQKLDSGDYLIRAIAGDLVQIPAPPRLDPESRKRLRIVLED